MIYKKTIIRDGDIRNGYIGISLRNKKFTNEYLINVVNRWFNNFKGNFSFLIVDGIQSINEEIFASSKVKKKNSKKIAIELGDECEKRIIDLIKGSFLEHNNRIYVYRRHDLQKDDLYVKNLEKVLQQYETNNEFQRFIQETTAANLGNIVNRLTQNSVRVLGKYLVNELPEISNGFKIDNIHRNCCIYPGDFGNILDGLRKKGRSQIMDYSGCFMLVDTSY